MFIEYADKLDAISILDPELLDELFALEFEEDRQRTLISIENRAKLLGCKTEFTKLYKARLKDIKKEKKETKQVAAIGCENVTDFGGQEFQLNCGSWICNDEGISTFTEKGQLVACSHPIFPVGILVNNETEEYKVVIRFKVRGIWKEIIENRDTIASSSKIVSLASKGVMVTSENAKLLVKYLSDIEAKNEDIIKEYKSTSKLGWINGKFMPYEEDIVFDNEDNLKSLMRSIHFCGDRSKWYECMNDIRQDRRLEVQIYFASSLASVLVEPCGTLPFIVSLWGGTGKGKTVALMMATSIWADPSEGAYMTDAKATTTAMEIRLDCLNSLPMTLDDMAQIKNQYDGDFSELVYRWCAGKGRDRSNQKLGLNKLTSWRNCTLTNGERSLITETMQGGAVNRIIDLGIGETPLFKDGNYTSKIFRQNYGYCGQEFVEIINQLGFEEVNRIVEGKIKQLKDIAKSKKQEKEDKQIIPMALILAADQIATDYLFKDDIYIDAEESCDILKNKGEVSEHKRAYEHLKGIITSQGFHFAEDSSCEMSGNVEMYGYWSEPEKIVIIGTIFDRIMNQAGFQSKAFLSWAKTNGLIECDKTGRPKKQVKVNGQNIRCVVLSLKDNWEKAEEFENVQDLEELPFE